jgi:hypothetical protein
VRRLLALSALLVLATACAGIAAAKGCGHHCPSPTTTTSPPPNVKRVAVMLVDFADDVRQPWTTDLVNTLYNGPAPSFDDFWTQSSWGQFTTSADVFGWFVTSTPVAGCSYAQMSSQANALATAAGVNLAAYTNYAYVFPQTNECHFAGTADFSGNRVWLDPQNCDVTNCWSTFLKPAIHEFGHNLGLDHAQSYICTDAGVHVVLSDTCTANEYGDPFSVMATARALLPNLQRLQLGWIPPSQVVTVTTTSTLTITNGNLQSSLVYRVPIGGQFLYLEERPGVDAYMNAPTPNLVLRRAPDYTALGMCATNPCFTKTQILDGSPADNDTSLNAKALPVGGSFTYGGVTITHVSWDGTIDEVQVSFA